jgi:cytochrome c-type biogenesis protein CcmH/NrfG
VARRLLINSEDRSAPRSLTLTTLTRKLPHLSDPTQKVERSLFKLFLWSGGILALIIALSVGGHRSFRRWQQHHLATQANAFFERGDYKRAGLDARRMMQLDPNSVEANRMMGRLSEKAGLRPAVDWYRRVVELTGGVNPDDVFALARAALRFRETATAEMAVAKLPPAVRETAAFHDLAADLALARQDGPAVVHELELATKTDPANKRYALRFATVRLISADSAVQEQGRASLATLQKDPGVGLAATRQLAADALRRKDFERALSLAEQLQSWPDKTFADRLLLLDIRQRSGDAGFEQLLAQLKTDAQGKPQDLADLLNWLNGHGMAARAIEWSATLPPELVAKRPVPLTIDFYFMRVVYCKCVL